MLTGFWRAGRFPSKTKERENPSCSTLECVLGTFVQLQISNYSTIYIQKLKCSTIVQQLRCVHDELKTASYK